MSRNRSFSERLHSGANKAELMKYYALDEPKYEKIIACLDRIQAAAQGGQI